MWIGLELDPRENARRIEERARAQFAAGLLDEAARLRERYDEDLPSFSAVGYREAFDALDGRIKVEQAVDINAARNRRLARRQRTWFRAEPDVFWLNADTDPTERAAQLAEEFLRPS